MVNTMTGFFNAAQAWQQNPDDADALSTFNYRKNKFTDEVSQNCIYLVIIGICMFVAVYVYMGKHFQF